MARSWIAEMPVHAFMAASLIRPRASGPLPLLGARLSGLDLGGRLGTGLRLMQDHAVEQPHSPIQACRSSARLVSA